MTKNPYHQKMNVKRQHKYATKYFDYTTIAVSWVTSVIQLVKLNQFTVFEPSN